jgi:hypothetical protein
MAWSLARRSASGRVGQLDLYVFQRLDLRDCQLWGGVFFTAEHAPDEHGDVDLELLSELFIGRRECYEFDLADGVF